MDSHRNNLAEFEDFLKRHRLVTPEKARFYVYWVDRFLKYLQNRPSKPVAQQKNLSDLADTVRARQKRRLPVVLTREEIHHLFSFLESPYLLMAQLLYGSGLRLMECIRLRVKDIDFANNLLIIRAGKGEKDRTTILPDKIKESLREHLQRMKTLHDQDLFLCGP